MVATMFRRECGVLSLNTLEGETLTGMECAPLVMFTLVTGVSHKLGTGIRSRYATLFISLTQRLILSVSVLGATKLSIARVLTLDTHWGKRLNVATGRTRLRELKRKTSHLVE
jgi:hypothetical protein